MVGTANTMNGPPDRAATDVVRVASWPGPSFRENAFIEIFCEALRRQGIEVVDVPAPRRADPLSFDILQIHWPEQILWGRGSLAAVANGVLTLLALRRLQKAGIRLVWMVHNLQPHDASPVELTIWRRFSRALARMVDGYATLSPATLPIVREHFPFAQGAASVAVHHPSYTVPAALPNRAAAKRRWQVPPGPLHLVFVGAIRRYKGIAELAELVAAMPSERLALTIAGRCERAQSRQFEQLAGDHANVRFHDGFLDDEAFTSLVRAADYVVLPFQLTLHSGSIVHALSLGRAVLTPRTPYAAELAEVVGREWLTLYDAPLTASTLDALTPAPSDEPRLEALEPAKMGRNLAQFYRMIAEPREDYLGGRGSAN